VLRTAVDAVELTRTLLAFNTINPPGNEAACASHLGSLLESTGFAVDYHEMAQGRVSLVAQAGNPNSARTICFVGHIDTVSLGTAHWEHGPFDGEIADGRLYGRGASDMKSGVAAFVAAAIASAPTVPDDAGIVLLIVCGEETGCEGSTHLASLGLDLGPFAGVIVGEPTGNVPLVGHKGALWLRAGVKGIAAHGAMPSAGENAIVKGMEVVRRLGCFCSARPAHPVLGQPTLNIGTFRAGQNVNSVPDWAEVGIDIRTTPGMEHRKTEQELATLLAPQLDHLSIDISMPHVYTSPDHAWVQRVFDAVEDITGTRPGVATAPYFSDASALQPLIGEAPTLILGPGEQHTMHQTDEYCEVTKLRDAVRIYEAVIRMTVAAHMDADSSDAARTEAQPAQAE
jgi:succinyl-diaminopimelate desuccinylase